MKLLISEQNIFLFLLFLPLSQANYNQYLPEFLIVNINTILTDRPTMPRFEAKKTFQVKLEDARKTHAGS